ncbi:carbohydrate kinase family protein [Vagococcus intermedius]|uniref:Carbohydrate kinase family protein n=1 Tax=Vagococcus intermedius TaxID=2991418 RepID=A0AAF0CTH4_9ENTE|nr:carbohydrate kinase family protein [Vagococcus intermedius]WEG72574.1 carbohydrate kinase family protein [Vagococcus intermedius]WEG74660.1 carbohydrate kinase family protein [Vagococcus intermedius]
MANQKYAVVLGGLNMDIAGISGHLYREHDSNIGRITLTDGGVGQNIAQNMVKLEVPTYLVTVYGDDEFGQILSKNCEKKGIDLTYAEKIKGKASSTYLYVTDGDGDMVSGVNDMNIIKYMTPEFFEKRIDFINSSELCVIDGNLEQESIEWLAHNVEVPIFVDPVSVAKAKRFNNVLNKIDTFKPNEIEAELFTGIKVIDEETGKKAAKELVELGVKNVFISLGEHGIICANQNEANIIPILKSNVVSCNGAGDCSMATIAWARFFYGETLSLTEVAQLTQAAASITVESIDAVSEHMNVTNVVKRAQQFIVNV